MLSVQLDFTAIDGDAGALHFEFKVPPKLEGTLTSSVHISFCSAAEGQAKAISNASPLNHMLNDYAPWSESGYALVARAVKLYGDKIRGATSGTPIEKLTLAISGAPSNQPYARKELTRITYDLRQSGAYLCVEGLVGRAVYPLSDDQSEGDLVRLTMLLCELCAVAPIDYDQFPHAPLVYFYSGGMLGEFVFVDEVPDAAYPWFVAYLNTYFPKSRYKNGQVALRDSWQAFLDGKA